MKFNIVVPVALAMSIAAPAFAFDGKVEKCFRKDYQEAEYSATQRKIQSEKHQYEQVSSKRVNLVRYPAVYVEELKKVKDDRYVLREVACK